MVRLKRKPVKNVLGAVCSVLASRSAYRAGSVFCLITPKTVLTRVNWGSRVLMGFMPVLLRFFVRLAMHTASIACILVLNALNASHPSFFMTKNA